MAKRKPTDIKSDDPLARIEWKLDCLLQSDSDEQVSGILASIRRTLDVAWVQRAIQAGVVLSGVWLLSKFGIISGDQQAELTKAATGGLLRGAPSAQVEEAPPAVEATEPAEEPAAVEEEP